MRFRRPVARGPRDLLVERDMPERDPPQIRRTTLAAHAKINLVLELLGPREDGFTEIATVYQTVGLADEVEVALEPGAGDVRLEVEGDEPCSPELNLAVRAAAAVREAAELANGVSIRLVKRIPAGAGLGGGSSDAAAVLFALNSLAGGPLGSAALAAIGANLGADVPYFLCGGLVLGRGRGDELTLLDDPPEWPVVLARIGPPLGTGEVYERARRGLTPRSDTPNILRFLSHLREDPRRRPPVFNGLQAAAGVLRPEMGRVLEQLTAAGGRASMSGSGSAVFGLFDDFETARRAAAHLADVEPAAWIEVTRTVSRRASDGRGVGRRR